MNFVDIILVVVIVVLSYFCINTFNPPNSNPSKDKSVEVIKNKTTKRRKHKKKPKKKNVKKSVRFDESINDVFLIIRENNKILGKIVIKLYNEVVPITCNNFRTLCVQKKYINTTFHRVIQDFMIQGGDYTTHDGRGGMSIYGSTFDDENFILKHDQPYLISMANRGPNTNGSQFFITTNHAEHLDNKHVVFGKIISGHNIIDYINNVNTDDNDKPITPIFIHDCGLC